VKNFKLAFTEVGSPFSDAEDSLIQVMTRTIMNSASGESVRNAENIRKKQYEEYVRKRLVTCEKSIHELIPKNNLPLFRKKNAVSTSKGKLKIASL
jgi:hypothetical protein